MNGLIWKIQKSFFTIITNNIDIISLKIPVYGILNFREKMPYIVITSIKITNLDNLQNNRKIADVKITIFDDKTSLKNIANIADIIEKIIVIENFQTTENLSFISIEKCETNFSNNAQSNATSISIDYKCFVEII